MSIQIAIIEDDKEISMILKECLESSGYETMQAFDGKEAQKLLEEKEPQLILMDLMLPVKSGERLIAELREKKDTPVIVISAKSLMETKLEVLRLGADDYIIKPFDLSEVLVRIEVVLRRSGITDKNTVLRSGELSLNTDENRAYFGSAPIQLTAKELLLLKAFLEHPKKVYTKAELYESIWNETYYYEDNTINVHVSNLRSKLKKASGRDYIETVWGIGYRLKEE